MIRSLDYLIQLQTNLIDEKETIYDALNDLKIKCANIMERKSEMSEEEFKNLFRNLNNMRTAKQHEMSIIRGQLDMLCHILNYDKPIFGGKIIQVEFHTDSRKIY